MIIVPFIAPIIYAINKGVLTPINSLSGQEFKLDLPFYLKGIFIISILYILAYSLNKIRQPPNIHKLTNIPDSNGPSLETIILDFYRQEIHPALWRDQHRVLVVLSEKLEKKNRLATSITEYNQYEVEDKQSRIQLKARIVAELFNLEITSQNLIREEYLSEYKHSRPISRLVISALIYIILGIAIFLLYQKLTSVIDSG